MLTFNSFLLYIVYNYAKMKLLTCSAWLPYRDISVVFDNVMF